MYLCKQVWSKYIQYSFKHYKDLQDIQWKKNTWITWTCTRTSNNFSSIYLQQQPSHLYYSSHFVRVEEPSVTSCWWLSTSVRCAWRGDWLPGNRVASRAAGRSSRPAGACGGRRAGCAGEGRPSWTSWAQTPSHPGSSPSRPELPPEKDTAKDQGC